MVYEREDIPKGTDSENISDKTRINPEMVAENMWLCETEDNA